VKIIAATNRIDLLDPALLRPGRFDRVIEVPLPDEKARLEILKIHTLKMNLSEDVDLPRLAKMSNGLSGADLKIIVKEAGMFVLRRKGEQITMKDMVEAFEKVTTEDEPLVPGGMFV
jgi:proteasome regulatory subunit